MILLVADVCYSSLGCNVAVDANYSSFVRFHSTRSWDIFVITLVMFVIWEAFQLSIPLWLEHWMSVMDTTEHSVTYYLVIYAVIIFAYIIVDVWLTYVCNVIACLRASVILHENVLARVLRLPMAFFDVTP